ncbi:hypothetical protein FNV43_RR15107 [Rhamnella rubrinervis]|uniref:Uncharacterized protein n=1 Tax=Rhamnella rubrinervis TaxID=2594499 RepID=A0A8K0E8C2_9ROSA|nr:hypothetical protein FNV43_RR15107 [Rhamnella rubrinervis]
MVSQRGLAGMALRERREFGGDTVELGTDLLSWTASLEVRSRMASPPLMEWLLRSLPLEGAVLSAAVLVWGSAGTNSMLDFFSEATTGLRRVAGFAVIETVEADICF